MSEQTDRNPRTSIDTHVLEKMLNYIAQRPWIEVRDILQDAQNSIRPCECQVNQAEVDDKAE